MLFRLPRSGRFRDALTGGDARPCLDLLADGPVPAAAGLALVRALAEQGREAALTAAYPALAALTGQAGFACLARLAFRARPPSSGVPGLWGEHLVDILALSEDAARHPWLVDLARFEWALHHACVARPLAPGPGARRQVRPDPSLSLLFADSDVAKIHSLALSGFEADWIDAGAPCHLLVYRHRGQVTLDSVEAEDWRALSVLAAAGENGDLTAEAAREPLLAEALRRGWFVAS